MEWLEQNLDAYRIIAEILRDLREVLRTEIEQRHGKQWFKKALPDGLLDRLIEAKEKEKAIDWYESEYQQIMSYAVFPDLLEILERNADCFPQIMRLAPTTALLHARFLELEVMRSKLGRARPISETELAFLGTFHLRFRKAIDDFRSSSPADRATAVPAGPAPAPSQPAPAAMKPSTAQPEPEPDLEEAADAEPLEIEAEEEALPPEQVVEDTPIDEAKSEESRRKAPRRPVTAKADGAVGKRIEFEPEVSPPEPEAVDELAEGATVEEVAGEEPPQRVGPTLEEALAGDDHRFVLRALYQEITATAEGIWSKDVLPVRRVWDKVSTSNWYEQNFSQLGLKPVSDFYEIMSKVDSQMRQGATKADLQDYLKQSNFARVLLSLRDMFQGHQI